MGERRTGWIACATKSMTEHEQLDRVRFADSGGVHRTPETGEQSAHGWKTYTFAGVAIVAGIVGAFFGVLETGDAATLILGGLIAIGLRDAQAKVIAAGAAAVAQQKGKAFTAESAERAQSLASDLRPPTSGVSP